MNARTQEIVAITAERVTLQEVLSALREMADNSEGAVAARIYRDLIQLFENRETAAAVRLQGA